jgi:hypothetical protein
MFNYHTSMFIAILGTLTTNGYGDLGFWSPVFKTFCR